MFLSTLLTFGSLFLSGTAEASDNYIGVGPYQFSPQVSLSYEYRSNIYLYPRDSDDPATPSGASLILNPVVKFKLDGSTVKFLAGTAYTARVYLDQELQDLNRFKDVQFIGSARLFPNGKAGLQLTETFSVSGREIEASLETGDGKDLSYIQSISSKTNLGLAFTPGPILSVNTGGSLALQYIQNTSKTDSEMNLNNKTDTGLFLDVHWKFLPKTTILLLGSRSSFDWEQNLLPNPSPSVSGAEYCQAVEGEELIPDCYVGTPDGSNSNMKIGISGQVSDNLILKTIVGMSSNEYSKDSVIDAMDSMFDSYTDDQLRNVTEGVTGQGVTTSLSGLEGLIYELGFTYFYTEKQQISLMYNRGNQDAFFTNYSIFRELKSTHVWKPNVKINITNLLNFRLDTYYGLVERSDIKLTYSGNAAYAFTKRLNGRVGLGYRELINTDPEWQDQVTFRDVSINAGLVWGY